MSSIRCAVSPAPWPFRLFWQDGDGTYNGDGFFTNLTANIIR